MRRLEKDQTFHGTTAGQAPNVALLIERFDLSERQAQCAALLRMGTPAAQLTDVLGISPSTLETHLADLRRKFDAATTADLERQLESAITDTDLDAFHCWPLATNALDTGVSTDATYAAALRQATSVEQALAALKAALAPLGVRHVYYCVVPHSVQGFLKGDIVDAFVASDAVVAAFRANNGLMGQPVALTLFNAPVSVPVAPLDPDAGPESLGAFNRACRADGATHLLGLGFPVGPGFVGMALTIAAEGDPTEAIEAQTDRIRAAAMTMHAAILTHGTLAARFRLTVRERDALSALAFGKKAADAAAEMKISDRAFAKLVASARGKFGAETNAEAIYKATLVNALVFL